MRYLILAILILVMLSTVGLVVLRKSMLRTSAGPAASAGPITLHGAYISADPGLGYSIDFDRYPGTAVVHAPYLYRDEQVSSYAVYGNKLHLAVCTLDLTLMPDGTIQCPSGFGPPPSGVTLKRRKQ